MNIYYANMRAVSNYTRIAKTLQTIIAFITTWNVKEAFNFGHLVARKLYYSWWYNLQAFKFCYKTSAIMYWISTLFFGEAQFCIFQSFYPNDFRFNIICSTSRNVVKILRIIYLLILSISYCKLLKEHVRILLLIGFSWSNHESKFIIQLYNYIFSTCNRSSIARRVRRYRVEFCFRRVSQADNFNDAKVEHVGVS